MSKEMRVPTVGESISEVTVGQWFKNDGDQVQLDEVLCELESDKATFEFPAEASGILRIKAKEGDTVEIGGLLQQQSQHLHRSQLQLHKPLLWHPVRLRASKIWSFLR